VKSPSPFALRGLSLLATMSFAAGGIAIGGGIPVSLSDLAGKTRAAADNARVAAENTEIAAENTEALASIAESVKSQLESSRRMLATQQKIEAATAENVRRSRSLTAVIRDIRSSLADLTEGLSGLSTMAAASGNSAETTAAAAARLNSTLRSLSARFAIVVAESRELNRKANAYEESTP
jgi:uncharacterized protein (DUF3084 family)